MEDYLLQMMGGTIFQVSEVGKQVREIRLKAGITQDELATLVSTHQPSIARLEADRSFPSTKLLKRIGDALGYDLKIVFVQKPNQEEVEE